jgi:uncharacterized OsmC-like protein
MQSVSARSRRSFNQTCRWTCGNLKENVMRQSSVANVSELPKIVNGVSVDNLLATIDVVKAVPSVAKFNFRIRNQWGDGAQNRSVVEDFYGAGEERTRSVSFMLMADEPEILQGKDVAANPVEHLLHALASCMTTSIVYHAAVKGIEIEEIESTLEGDIDLRGFLGLDPTVRNGYQGIRVSFRIKANVSDVELQQLGQLGPERSPVFNSLTAGVPVAVKVDRL